MTDLPSGRRRFMATALGSAAALAGAGARPRTASAADDGAGFAFEVTRSDAEWRARLSPEEFRILRENDTELPNTSPLVNELRKGVFCCKGCDLTLYDSHWKVPLDIGWVFFSHSRERALLTAIDGAPPPGMGERDPDAPQAMIEVHCRRCGSHMGHLVIARGQLVHCINGASLSFRPAGA